MCVCVLGVFFFRVCAVCVCVVLQWLVLFRFVRERGRRLNHFASLALLMLYRGSAAFRGCAGSGGDETFVLCVYSVIVVNQSGPAAGRQSVPRWWCTRRP